MQHRETEKKENQKRHTEAMEMKWAGKTIIIYSIFSRSIPLCVCDKWFLLFLYLAVREHCSHASSHHLFDKINIYLKKQTLKAKNICHWFQSETGQNFGYFETRKDTAPFFYFDWQVVKKDAYPSINCYLVKYYEAVVIIDFVVASKSNKPNNI